MLNDTFKILFISFFMLPLGIWKIIDIIIWILRHIDISIG